MARTNGTITDAGVGGNSFAKLIGEWPMFAFNYEAILDGQRRNWAALVEANKVWSDNAQALATRQMELARQAMHDFAELVEETMRKPGAFEDQIGKSAVCTRHALEGICDLADHATKSGTEVMKLFNKRMSETLDDARGYA
ncbi:MAG: phasin family protein, partial [Stellaceae bacterium]